MSPQPAWPKGKHLSTHFVQFRSVPEMPAFPVRGNAGARPALPGKRPHSRSKSVSVTPRWRPATFRATQVCPVRPASFRAMTCLTPHVSCC